MNRLLLALSLSALAACGNDSVTGAGKPTKLQIAVIPKGTTHEFWKAVHEGAQRAAGELGVDIIWKGPLRENDRAEQIKLVEQFTAQGVGGIVVAPLDDKALVRPIKAARERGLPVVIFDSALAGKAPEDFQSFVATDNLEGGRRAGRELCRLLGGKGKAVMMRYQVGSASTADREAGFLEVMAENPGIEILSSDQYGGASVDSAKTKALNMLDVLRAADGVFCPNESSTVGMLRALQQENLLGKLSFVGFDSSAALVAALRSGEIDALVLQDPVDMGYRAVKTLVEHKGGATVPPRIDTRLAVATKANMDDPAVAPLLR
ncbi:MAG: substrate-binding domain-containing protein [Planctomycetes bacterium]|nr:substrate-binding domain-containing protein [Planctomycetota bacterium]